VPANPAEPVASLTFNIGNTPSSTFGGIANVQVIVPHTQYADAFNISETFSGTRYLNASINMINNNYAQAGPFASTELPSSLALTDFSLLIS
jgi:hypothetical protein